MKHIFFRTGISIMLSVLLIISLTASAFAGEIPVAEEIAVAEIEDEQLPEEANEAVIEKEAVIEGEYNSVSGIIVGKDGKRLTGAVVTLSLNEISAMGDLPPYESQTFTVISKKGFYYCLDIPNGDYTLKVQSGKYDGDFYSGFSTSFSLMNDKKTVDIQLDEAGGQQTYTISGKVTSVDTGKAIKDAEVSVMIYDLDLEYYDRWSGYSDKNGNYKIIDIPYNAGLHINVEQMHVREDYYLPYWQEAAAIQDGEIIDIALEPVSAPVITKQPANQRVNIGDSVTFKVEGSGNSNLAYKWYVKKGGEFQPISKANGKSTYTIQNTKAYMSGYQYKVVVFSEYDEEICVHSQPAKIIFDDLVPVNKISLNISNAVLSAGKSVRLRASVAPTNATEKAVKWSSGNSKVATVDSKGVVKAVSAGKTVITAKATDGSNVSAKCTVVVA